MSKSLSTSHDLAIHAAGKYTMLSLADEFVESMDTASRRARHPAEEKIQARAVYGFFPYVIDKTVYISPGEVRFNDAEMFHDGQGSFAPLTLGYSLSNLTPNSSGVLYLRIDTADSAISFETAVEGSQGAIIGDDDNFYVLELHIDVYQVQVIAPLSSPHILQYASSMPANTHNSYHKKLATVTVDVDGFPTVTPIHLGTVHVPIMGRYKSVASMGLP